MATFLKHRLFSVKSSAAILTAITGLTLGNGFLSGCSSLQTPTRTAKNGTTERPTLSQNSTKNVTPTDDAIDQDSATGQTNDFVIGQLETARQHYVYALGLIDRADTVHAARSFEEAIDVLNRISTYPGIERNTEFTDLAQSILEDYESYVTSIDKLDDNSSIFILNKRLSDVIESEISPKKSSQVGQAVIEIKPPADGSVPFPAMKVPLTIPLTDHDAVRKSIQFYTSPTGRKFFQKWLERSGKWFPFLRQIAAEEGVPEELIYLSMIESGLNPNAFSRAKAAGMWQFIKTTGEMYGLNAGFWVDERREPERSARAGMRHLKDLHTELGDWQLALAAYNSGLGGVRRAIARSGKDRPNFWELRALLPKETRDYVPYFIATTVICQNPAYFGFDSLAYQSPYSYETMPISESVDLDALERAAALPNGSIVELNPDLLQKVSPPNVRNFPLKVPVGTKSIVMTAYTAMPDETKRSWVLHEVRRGETLKSIAARYGSDATLIVNANALPAKKKTLAAGELLKVPIPAGISLRGAVTAENLAEAAQRKQDSLQALLQAQTLASQTSTNSDNDNAANTETSIQNVAQTSDKQNTEVAVVTENSTEGQDEEDTLVETTSTSAVTSAVQMSPEKSSQITTSRPLAKQVAALTRPAGSKKIIHKVRRNETLSSIARAYGVRMTDVRNWNNLPYNAQIQAGQNVVVYAEKNQSTTNDERVLTSSHKVRKGETLATIADDYNVEVSALRKANKLSRSAIKAGQVLKIPGRETAKSIAEYSKSSKHSNTALAHRVRKGETPAQIAEEYGVSVGDIVRWNPKNATATKILAGTTLKIYAGDAEQRSAKGDAQPRGKSAKEYTVKQGETLYAISRKFGVTVESLQKLNKSIFGERVKAGQTIRIQ